MKVVLAIILALGSVSARGSGPYLPSGWKPQGPAFYLPSEIAKPTEASLKQTLVQETEASGSDSLQEYGPPKLESTVETLIREAIVQESEASGSDALREYGPPKLEVSNDNNSQGLPDVVTEQTFFVVATPNQDVIEEAITAQVNNEQVATEVIVTPTESQIADLVEVKTTETEIEPTAQIKIAEESVTEQISEAIVEAQDITEDVRTTEKNENLLEELVVPVTQEEVETTPETVAELIVPTSIAQEETLEPLVIAEEETIAPTAGLQEELIPTSEVLTEEKSAIILDEVVPTVQETAAILDEVAPTVQENVAQETPVVVVEAVVAEKVEEGVKNIAETIFNLEQQVKAEVQAIQEITEFKLTQETSGTLEQAPEGFLEYGPPGFTEYGPPKQEDLARAAIVELPSTSAFENNEVRRRRFSPRFRSTKN